MPLDDNAIHREQLIQTLAESGLNAYEATDEDSTKSVNLAIFDTRYSPAIVAVQDPELKAYIKSAGETWSTETYLQIVIKDIDDTSIIGVVGQKGEGGKIYELGEWQRAATIDQAILIVQSLWTGRDVLLNEFISNK